MDKKLSRLRRAVPTRRKISELGVHRLSIFRSNLHIYANIIAPEGDRVLVSASTLEPEVRTELAGKTGKGGNTAAASIVVTAVTPADAGGLAVTGVEPTAPLLVALAQFILRKAQLNGIGHGDLFACRYLIDCGTGLFVILRIKMDCHPVLRDAFEILQTGIGTAGFDGQQAHAVGRLIGIPKNFGGAHGGAPRL